ncbi:Shikimate kinase 2 [Marinobacterium sp. xm-a-121]|uniref:helix-turn-helix transcriptional regulator n=1 Tax=Marinobacterium sp. xm-a-121 TaxID=2497743 RepID=UPI001569506F|nr:helix-turn-helix transcriptional regulator [Marinobacterium sp. xm-a-121]NRP37643.1 Shikimate kinase 2 [Marinobacterium sp. xm-a-121]
MNNSDIDTQFDELALQQYIEEIGIRVRSLRAKRGMTRKSLSKHSDVSERYLAQLETGKANITLSVLWRVAEAFDIPFSEIIPDQCRDGINPLFASFVSSLTEEQQNSALQLLKRHFASSLASGHGVALVGLRGAGKTTLGQLLAKEMNVRFIRLTALIEELANMSIGEILDLGGQKKFRRIEAQALEYVLNLNEPVILETGGSLVSQTESFKLLLDNFFSVWIKASPEEHLSRVMDQGDTRPMAGLKEAIEDLKLILEERESGYKLSDYTLDTTGRTESECLAELKKTAGAFLH